MLRSLTNFFKNIIRGGKCWLFWEWGNRPKDLACFRGSTCYTSKLLLHSISAQTSRWLSGVCRFSGNCSYSRFGGAKIQEKENALEIDKNKHLYRLKKKRDNPITSRSINQAVNSSDSQLLQQHLLWFAIFHLRCRLGNKFKGRSQPATITFQLLNNETKVALSFRLYNEIQHQSRCAHVYDQRVRNMRRPQHWTLFEGLCVDEDVVFSSFVFFFCYFHNPQRPSHLFYMTLIY